MPLTLTDAIKTAQLVSDGAVYEIIHLPPNAITAAAGVIAEIGEPFTALIVDKDEVTLVLPADALKDFSKRLRGARPAATTYRLITFDVDLSEPMVGFMARISAALAAAGVNIMPYAAYQRDHLLVPTDQFEAALNALRQLQASL